MIDTSDNTIHTANAVFYKTENGENKYLLVEEPDGYWGLPGGAKDVDDKDITATLQRELKEELGLLPNDYQAIKTDIKFEFQYDHPGSSRFGKRGVIHMFIIKWGEKEIRPTKELKGIKWLIENEAVELFTLKDIKKVFKKTIDTLK